MTKKNKSICVGISNIIRKNKKLYMNLFFDIDDCINYKLFCNFLIRFSNKYDVDFIVIKSGNKTNGYHAVIPQVFNKNYALLLFKIFKLRLKYVLGYKVGNFKLQKALNIKYRLDKNRLIKMGSVLRISNKHNKKIKVVKVIINPYKKLKRCIAIDLLNVYMEYGLSKIDYMNLLNSNNDITNTNHRYNIYVTGG